MARAIKELRPAALIVCLLLLGSLVCVTEGRADEKAKAKKNAADGKRTLWYWNERTIINYEVLVSLGNGQLLRNLRSTNWAKVADKRSAAWSKYVQRVSDLDITGVDEEVVRAFQADVRLMRRKATALSNLATSSQLDDRQGVRLGMRDLDAIHRKNEVVFYEKLDGLRIKMSKKYDLKFPGYSTGVGKKLVRDRTNKERKAGLDKAAKGPAKAATSIQRARSTLKLARSLITKGKTQTAKQYLQRIIDDYPETDSARTAREILGKL
jgi:hypothetical protein